MKTAEQPKNGSLEFSLVDPMLFGVSFNDVDVAFRGGTYAIRPSRNSVNPQTGFPTHGVYCVQKMEILDGDFAGEIRTKAYYVGGLAGSIPKGSPPRVLLVPSADGKSFVGGLSPEDVISLAIGTATFGEDEYSNYEGMHLLQPKDRSMPLRQDSQYGQLVESIKKLYPVGKNGKPNEIAYGTTFPGVLENKGPDFATGYGFHMRLEGEEFKTLVAVSALGKIEPTTAQSQTTQSQTPTQVAADLASGVNVATPTTNGSEFTVESVRPMIYQALASGPRIKNEIISSVMNSTNGDKTALLGLLLQPGIWETDLWAQGADGKFALR